MTFVVIIFASLIFYSEKIAAGSDGRNGMSSVIDTGSLYSQHGNENQFLSIIGIYIYNLYLIWYKLLINCFIKYRSHLV